MLPASFIIVAILLRLAAGASYVRATWQGTAQPSIVSWFFWSVTALIAFTVQLIEGAGPAAWVTLAIGLSPLAVCIAAMHKRGYKITFSRSDKWSIALTLAGIIMWLVSKDPLMALFMSILADIFSSIPTILKSYSHPESEHPTAYVISIISMAITLLTVTNWHIANWLFAAYILAINLTYVLTITVFSKFRKLSIRAMIPITRGDEL